MEYPAGKPLHCCLLQDPGEDMVTCSFKSPDLHGCRRSNKQMGLLAALCAPAGVAATPAAAFTHHATCVDDVTQADEAHLGPAAAGEVCLLAALHVPAGGADVAVAVRVPVRVLALALAALAAAPAVVVVILVVKVEQAPPA